MSEAWFIGFPAYTSFSWWQKVTARIRSHISSEQRVHDTDWQLLEITHSFNDRENYLEEHTIFCHIWILFICIVLGAYMPWDRFRLKKRWLSGFHKMQLKNMFPKGTGHAHRHRLHIHPAPPVHDKLHSSWQRVQLHSNSLSNKYHKKQMSMRIEVRACKAQLPAGTRHSCTSPGGVLHIRDIRGLSEALNLQQCHACRVCYPSIHLLYHSCSSGSQAGWGWLKTLPLPDSQQGRKGIKTCHSPSTGLQISLYFYSVVSTICNRGEKSGEVKKQSRPSGNAKNIKKERERGNNCEAAALKEETWTHKQKNLDQDQEICQQEKCKWVKFAFICALGGKIIDWTQTPTPITVSDLYMQYSRRVAKHSCVRPGHELLALPSHRQPSLQCADLHSTFPM